MNGVSQYPRQAGVGLALAALVIACWLALHIYTIFVFNLDGFGVVLAPFIVAVICWLNVGLFIVAHDAMHGSLVPFRPWANRAIGRVCLAIYAGFSYDRLIGPHFDHHRHAGTERDPDFHADGPRAFWPWFATFFMRYFGLREFLLIFAVNALYLFVFKVPPANAILFWGVPALLSSLQLFYFGTYLPHRHEDEPFTDRHNARSNSYSVPLSLLTCFHFGYHHEHHEHPNVPWWRLPSIRETR